VRILNRPLKSEEAQCAANASKLSAIVEDPDNVLPVDAIPTLKVFAAVLAHLVGSQSLTPSSPVEPKGMTWPDDLGPFQVLAS
jgi:hypothetical protein